MSRALPHPVLAASLLVMWILLNGFSLGHVLLGSVIAIAASNVMVRLQPAKPSLRRWYLLPKLVLIVLVDIWRSNVAVAGVILGPDRGQRTSGFITIPLTLRHRTGLAVLACILTSTPGTAWVEYNASQSTLLLHVLDLVDEEHWITLIKNRYERLLLEIFE
jgi:multicomponent K+:H+ antiporter subunit E